MSSCGTPNYMAPEQLLPNRGHSFEADVWALGVVIFYMLVGRSPFSENAKDMKSLHLNINDVKYTFPTDIIISREAKDLIKCLLQKKESDRMKVDDIPNHPFFKTNNIPLNLPHTFLNTPPSEEWIESYPKKKM